MPAFAKFRHLLTDVITLRRITKPWRMPCFAALGALAGLGLSTAHISRAASYMSDAPETCTNCHVMFPAYTTWQHSSHREVATCNDCHVPHTNFAATYAFKAQDGMRHSAIFTARAEPQVIRLSRGAVPVIEDNCRRCHTAVVDDVAIKMHATGDQRCWDCHRDVPHGRGRNLSVTPRIMVPQLPAPLSLDHPRIQGRDPRPSRGSP